MSKSKPALQVLGISPEFVQIHSKEVVLAVAESTYRAAANKYHPDKGDERVPLPKSVSLSDLAEARDKVRENLDACIKELASSERKSRDSKKIDELTLERVEEKKQMKLLTEKLNQLWTQLSRNKLGAKTPDVKLDEEGTRMGYSASNLGGLGIVISKSESAFSEYLLHNGVWFERKLQRVNFGNFSHCPPGIPEELIFMTGNVRSSGNYYDQVEPHTVLENFQLLGSYEKAALTRQRKKTKDGKNDKEDKDDSAVSNTARLFAQSVLGKGTHVDVELDADVQAVLQPYIAVGHVVVAVMQTPNGAIQYKQIGTVTVVRTFDQKQRS